MDHFVEVIGHLDVDSRLWSGSRLPWQATTVPYLRKIDGAKVQDLEDNADLQDTTMLESTYSESSSDEQPDKLDIFAESNEHSRKFRTTYVLQCFNRTRRGQVVNRLINDWLDDNELEMTPAIADADYYGEVEIRRRGSSNGRSPADSRASITSASAGGISGVNSWVLSSLKDDAEELDFLEYGTSVDGAIEVMKQKGRTKLPLFFSKEDRSSLIGTVTLAQLTYDPTTPHPKLVEKATVQVPVVGTNEKLFDWIPTILRHGFIYGKNQDDEIVQIYTTFDVATHLNAIAAMFLRANEIEELLREVLARVPEDDLKNARSQTRSLKEIPLDISGTKYFGDEDLASGNSADARHREVDSMMFSDYMKCIGDPQIWNDYFQSTGVPGINKETCMKSLNDARIARNTVMHFNRSDSLANLIPSFEALAVWLRQVART
jgi:hypothetical protein